MTKSLRKAITLSSKMKNTNNKKSIQESLNSYKKQRTSCVDLLRKMKKYYFSNLNIKDVSDNKKFCKKIKPCVSNKGLNSNKLLLIERDKLN